MSLLVRSRLVLWKFLLFLLLLTLVAGAFSFVAFYGWEPSLASVNDAAFDPFTVVLDAGHGGEDGGAVSESGIAEKDVNLAIAMQLKALLEANGIRVVMTRETDVLLYDRNVDYRGRKKALDLAARRRIGEETENSIFVSIHLNAYPQSQYRGLQVWYSPNNERSRVLAESIQTTVQNTLQPENDRRIKQATSSIYLLHHLTTPAVLVECGFLSNPEEAELLASEEYQHQLALTLFAAILNYASQT